MCDTFWEIYEPRCKHVSYQSSKVRYHIHRWDWSLMSYVERNSVFQMFWKGDSIVDLTRILSKWNDPKITFGTRSSWRSLHPDAGGFVGERYHFSNVRVWKSDLLSGHASECVVQKAGLPRSAVAPSKQSEKSKWETLESGVRKHHPCAWIVARKRKADKMEGNVSSWLNAWK